MKKRFVVLGRIASMLSLLVGVAIALVSCDKSGKKETASTPSKQATAAISSASGSEVTGTAVFKQSGDSITLTVEIQNATPGLHAVHIHEKGDCSSPDGKSAGGHWNPTEVAHGEWGEGEFHLGDIGNMTVGDDGAGKIELTTDQWEMGTGFPSVILSEKASSSMRARTTLRRNRRGLRVHGSVAGQLRCQRRSDVRVK